MRWININCCSLSSGWRWWWLLLVVAMEIGINEQSSKKILDHLCDMLWPTFANLTDIKLCVTVSLYTEICWTYFFGPFVIVNAFIRSAVFVSAETTNWLENSWKKWAFKHPECIHFSIYFPLNFLSSFCNVQTHFEKFYLYIN